MSTTPGDELVLCEECRWQKDLCLCNRLPQIDLPTRFVVVQHASELYRQSNTGRWVPRILTNSALVTHGSSGERTPCRLDEELVGNAFVLFPLPGIPELTPEVVESPSTLVLLDGTWPQARRLKRRVVGLRGLPLLALPNDAPSSWRARRSPEPSKFCTLEAVARALDTLGFLDAATTVEHTLREIDSCLLQARGRRGGVDRV